MQTVRVFMYNEGTVGCMQDEAIKAQRARALRTRPRRRRCDGDISRSIRPEKLVPAVMC